MESFSAGNFPIQMDGFFFLRLVPGAPSWLSRPPAASFLGILPGETGGFFLILRPSSNSDSIPWVPTFRRKAVVADMEPVEALRRAIAQGEVLVVVGSGVSVAATGGAKCASLSGLLWNGIAWCESHLHSLPARWGDRSRESLASGDLDEMLGVASQIEAKLSGSEFRAWLRSSVGSLSVQHSDLIEAIWMLGCPIATTNYDDVLRHGHLERPVWTWLQHAQALSWARKERAGVFHLHGHWDFPESVVLDLRSYENLLDASGQAVLQALGSFRSFLYIGCGEGLFDPRFKVFREWLDKYSGSGFFHYRLCLEREAAELERRHSPEEAMRIVTYGPHYEDLVPFLRSLVSGSRNFKPPSYDSKEAQFFFRDEVLAHKQPSLPPADQEPLRIESAKPPQIFISYSHIDEAWKDRLVGHLGVLESVGALEVWHDQRIQVGSNWRQEIERALEFARVAILLISKDFLTSPFILQSEVPKLLERRRSQGLKVIPLFVRPCAWQAIPWLSEIQGRPKNGNPLSTRGKHQVESHLAALAMEIYEILKPRSS
jgi:hypothetical protein